MSPAWSAISRNSSSSSFRRTEDTTTMIVGVTTTVFLTCALLFSVRRWRFPLRKAARCWYVAASCLAGLRQSSSDKGNHRSTDRRDPVKDEQEQAASVTMDIETSHLEFNDPRLLRDLL